MKDAMKIKEDVLEFLKSNNLAVISTVSKMNIPQAALVLYMIDEDFNFYFVTRRQTRKFENLMENKNIAAVVGTVPAATTVQLNGIAELMGAEGEEFLNKLSGNPDLKEFYYGPFLGISGIDFAVFKVKINWLRYLYLDVGTMKEEYYQII